MLVYIKIGSFTFGFSKVSKERKIELQSLLNKYKNDKDALTGLSFSHFLLKSILKYITVDGRSEIIQTKSELSDEVIMHYLMNLNTPVKDALINTAYDLISHDNVTPLPSRYN